MFFRGRQPEATVWRRFRSGIDGFAFSSEGELYVARVIANSDRVVDLFHALTEHLAPAVDVVIEDVRSGRSWRGEQIALDDVRETVARLKLPLSTHGGVELSVFTSDDQLTIDPHLELWAFARTEQWLYLLLGKGLEQRDVVRARSWRLTPSELTPAPELELALGAAAERLGLTGVEARSAGGAE
jgi:hypothetical protein